jgi:hypothetical protein
VTQQARHGGQKVGGGFAGPGLGLPRHIMTLQGKGQGLGLDRRAVGKARLPDPFDKRVREVETREGGSGKMLLTHCSKHNRNLVLGCDLALLLQVVIVVRLCVAIINLIGYRNLEFVILRRLQAG